MAQSIYEIMEKRVINVTDNGENFTIDTPEWFPTSLDDFDVIKEKFGEDAILAKAIAQIIIELRAVARSARADEEKDMDEELAKFDVTAPRKPKKALTKEEQIAELFAEMSEEEIQKLMAKMAG